MFNVWYWKTYGLKFPATAEYVRHPDRIYTIMDFQDGEVLTFHNCTEKPSSNAAGYALYENRDGFVRMVNINELREMKRNSGIEDVKEWQSI